MKKNEIRGIAVLAIIAVVFSVIAFAAPFVKNGVFWLAYVFGLVSVAVQGYALYTGFVRGEPRRSKLYGFPVARLGTIYMAGQLAASLVFMLVAPWIPGWIVGILCVVALAAVAVGIISAEAVREEIEAQDTVLKKDVKTIRALQSKVRTMAGQWEHPALTKFDQELRYSDPVSAEALTDIEAELAAQVADLQAALVDGDQEAVEVLCKKATLTLAERNRLCKLQK